MEEELGRADRGADGDSMNQRDAVPLVKAEETPKELAKGGGELALALNELEVATAA